MNLKEETFRNPGKKQNWIQGLRVYQKSKENSGRIEQTALVLQNISQRELRQAKTTKQKENECVIMIYKFELNEYEMEC